MRMSSFPRRVVITGLGVISPLGIGLASNWTRLLNPLDSGISPNVLPNLPSKVAGRVSDFPFESIKRGSQMCELSTEEALKDASLDMWDKERVGVSIGMAMSDLQYIGQMFDRLSEGKSHKISPYFIPNILPNYAGLISMKYGCMGPLHSISTACATGSHAIGDAFRLIHSGDADVMIAGGVDTSLNELSVVGFCRLRALSTKHNDSTASRPFDRDRDGFVISEGAGVLVLEDLEHALKRNAPKIYCEILGYGLSGDANHVTASREDGKGSALAIQASLKGLDPSKVAYVNAHATSTPLGDKAEMKAIKRVFKDSIIKITANKGHIGHLLGAAGAVESAFVSASIKSNTIPPTANIQNLDSEILGESLEVIQKPEKFNSDKKPYVLKNSFGFGGYNVSLLFSKYFE
uniref:beta-ketoacyl-[acyl-carrier-protein] synthase I n=1 Tax=Lepeophtheirus salmonis TaxID=72036 RepID=D3PGF9_LEPSM|nr:3-oxoacyl-acyl-carrier-protein synthase 2 [Lepeophtheirus salmonis]